MKKLFVPILQTIIETSSIRCCKYYDAMETRQLSHRGSHELDISSLVSPCSCLLAAQKSIVSVPWCFKAGRIYRISIPHISPFWMILICATGLLGVAIKEKRGRYAGGDGSYEGLLFITVLYHKS
ncbi:hypothetical protein BDZ91DRAFT_712861 [Kalaharituber pfeilii]|nr:hypothetical protein BDZ91DRAFT_712861 [Kalaharituber pfeilii]